MWSPIGLVLVIIWVTGTLTIVDHTLHPYQQLSDVGPSFHLEINMVALFLYVVRSILWTPGGHHVCVTCSWNWEMTTPSFHLNKC